MVVVVSQDSQEQIALSRRKLLLETWFWRGGAWPGCRVVPSGAGCTSCCVPPGKAGPRARLIPLPVISFCQHGQAVPYQHCWSLNLGWLENTSPRGITGVSEGLGTAEGFSKGTGTFGEAWALQQRLLVHAGTFYVPVFGSWWTESGEVRCAHISWFRESSLPPSRDPRGARAALGAGAKVVSLVISTRALAAETQQVICRNLSSPSLWSP